MQRRKRKDTDDEDVKFCSLGIVLLIIHVTWKAEWVGGLTLDTHPASKTPSANASSV